MDSLAAAAARNAVFGTGILNVAGVTVCIVKSFDYSSLVELYEQILGADGGKVEARLVIKEDCSLKVEYSDILANVELFVWNAASALDSDGALQEYADVSYVGKNGITLTFAQANIIPSSFKGSNEDWCSGTIEIKPVKQTTVSLFATGYAGGGSGGGSGSPGFVRSLAALGQTGLGGDVTISAGSGVAVTQSGSNIEVSLSGGEEETVTLASLGGAPVASPAFTGTPTAPTPASSDDSTRIATTAWANAWAAAQGFVTSLASYATQSWVGSAISSAISSAIGALALGSASTHAASDFVASANVGVDNGVASLNYAGVLTSAQRPTLDAMPAPAAALSMNHQKLSLLANGVATDDACTVGQLGGKADTTTVAAGTYTKVGVTSQGTVNTGGSLEASDIPDLSSTYQPARTQARETFVGDGSWTQQTLQHTPKAGTLVFVLHDGVDQAGSDQTAFAQVWSISGPTVTWATAPGTSSEPQRVQVIYQW